MIRATLTEQEIRRIVGVPGEGDFVIDRISTLSSLEDKSLYFIDHKIAGSVQESLAGRTGCIVLVRDASGWSASGDTCHVLEIPEPRAAMAKVLGFVRNEGRQQRWIRERKISATATISPLAVIGDNVEIADGVVIEPFSMIDPDVAIGRNSVISSGARIFSRVRIGEESVIGANAVVGTEGFGFVRDDAGNKSRIPHLGGVIIGSNVEIGALSLVQCGTISPTAIEDYSKICDYVMVAHNAHIGRSVTLTAGVVVGGSAVIEEEAWIGMNSTIRNGYRVGSHSLIGMDVSVQQDLSSYTAARAPLPDIRSTRE